MNSLKVLYVEDDQFTRDEMLHFLKKRVGKAYAASDGLEGIELYELHKPDIIVVDLLMPRMNGMEMIRELRNRGSKVHVIVVTSVTTVNTVIDAVDLGIDSYIIKPIDFAELETKLNKIGEQISLETYKSKGYLDTLENKRMIEDNIKRNFVKFFKEYTGKGPKETVVQMLGDSVKITMFGSLTLMEENLCKDIKNRELVRHLRQVLYETIADKIEKIISENIHVNVAFSGMRLDIKKNVEQIELTIK